MSEEDRYRLIEMAWQDRTPFDAIKTQFGLNENQIKSLMRKLLSPASFRRWRERVQRRGTKHLQRCNHKPTRFQGPW